jgi:hypothetical protein
VKRTENLKSEYEYATEEYYEEEVDKSSPKIKAQPLQPEEIMASPAQQSNDSPLLKKTPTLDPYNKFLQWTD